MARLLFAFLLHVVPKMAFDFTFLLPLIRLIIFFVVFSFCSRRITISLEKYDIHLFRICSVYHVEFSIILVQVNGVVVHVQTRSLARSRARHLSKFGLNVSISVNCAIHFISRFASSQSPFAATHYTRE